MLYLYYYLFIWIWLNGTGLDWMCTQTLCACTVHAYIRTHLHHPSIRKTRERWVMCVCCREKTSSLSSRLAQLRRRNKCFCISERHTREKRRRNTAVNVNSRTKEKKRNEVKRREKSTREIENDNGNRTHKSLVPWYFACSRVENVCACECVCVLCMWWCASYELMWACVYHHRSREARKKVSHTQCEQCEWVCV